MSKFLQLIEQSVPTDERTTQQKAVRYISNIINNLAESAGESEVDCTFDVFKDAINITVGQNIFKFRLESVGSATSPESRVEDDETQSVDQFKRIKDMFGAAEALTGPTQATKRLFGRDPDEELAKTKGDFANRISQGIKNELGRLRI
jgi:hypothetical protein